MNCFRLGTLGLLLCAPAVPGCLPFAVPPARVSLGPAAHVGRVPGSSRADSQRGFTVLRAATHPLDLASDAEDRVFDVGLGYQGEFPAADSATVPTVHGPYLELGAYPLSAPLGSGVHFRGGAYGTVDGLWRDGGREPGFGGSLGVLFEVAGSAAGTFAGTGSDGSLVAGYARGRWGVGLWGSGSVRDFSDGAYRAVAAGLSVRIPLLAGVVCCAWPEFGGRARASSSSRSGSTRPGRRLVREPAHPRRSR